MNPLRDGQTASRSTSTASISKRSPPVAPCDDIHRAAAPHRPAARHDIVLGKCDIVGEETCVPARQAHNSPHRARMLTGSGLRCCLQHVLRKMPVGQNKRGRKDLLVRIIMTRIARDASVCGLHNELPTHKAAANRPETHTACETTADAARPAAQAPHQCRSRVSNAQETCVLQDV
jgi:hypothetical protein